MKIKVIIALCAVAILSGCNQSADEMNEPAGTQTPSYQAPDRSTNAPSASTNQSGTNSAGNVPPAGGSIAP